MKTNSQSISIPGASNFRFSAVRPEDLGATEYTLVTIVVDVSASVSDFSTELLDSVRAIVEACRKSPRADNLLIRLLTFNNCATEVFGFKTLRDIKRQDLRTFTPDGCTALYDATFDGIAATAQYAKLLYDQDFDTNAAVYVITDGEDNRSRSASPKKINQQLGDIRVQETLESISTVLIGINTQSPRVTNTLADFASKAGFDQFIDAGDASAQSLAKLAGFVSRSISSQSQALGSGVASQTLTF